MAYSKIGFHIGSQANATGYGDYIRALDAAGIPAGCMSVGGEGIGDIVACWDDGSTVPHVVVVRYMPPPGHPDGSQDVPRYDMEPEAAFVRFWAWVKPLIGPDVKRYSQRIVIKMGNELDKGQSEWLADFYLVGHDIMQSDPDGPFRLGAFGFASGEPEPGHWRGPRMLDYLRLCADDPIGAAIILHEYSYADTLQSGYPFLIGRFQDLFAACDENGIKRPWVYIHEGGWRQDSMPPVSEAMTQLPWAAELYAQFPEVKAVGLWTLQGSGTYGNPHISKLAQPMIEPIKNYTLTAEFPDPPEEPEQPPDGKEPPMEKQIEVIITTELPGQPVQIRGWDKATGRRVKYVQRRWMHHDGAGIVYTGWETIPIPATIADLRGIEFMPVHDFTVTKTITVECPDEPANPNPPPPILTLPAGAKGVDLSNYQAGFFDFVDPADFDFYIFRCSDGMNTSATSTNHDAAGVDKSLWKFADVGHVSMRPWGIYHYLRPGNVQGQVNKVLGILQALKERGTPPRTAVFDNGVKLPAVWIDVEDGALASAQVQEFYNLVAAGHHTGIYTGKPIWELITAGAAVWWANVPLWIAAYGVNDGNVPPWTNGPFLPRGWIEAMLWQYSSNPIDKNIVGPYPPTATQPPAPPPATGQMVDTLPYFQPTGTHGRYVVFHFSDGRTQAQQMEKLPDGRTILWKGEGQLIDGKMVYDYEEILVDADGVKKFKDTSSGGRTAYDLDGVVWLPRIVEIGKVYQSSPTVREFDRVTCQTTASNQTTDYIYVKALLPVWTSPIDPSITFNDVLVCEWRKTPDTTTPPIEVYKLAKDTLYVEWNNGAVGELPEGRQSLSFDLTDCQ